MPNLPNSIVTGEVASFGRASRKPCHQSQLRSSLAVVPSATLLRQKQAPSKVHIQTRAFLEERGADWTLGFNHMQCTLHF
jgi:hypothetical protein